MSGKPGGATTAEAAAVPKFHKKKQAKKEAAAALEALKKAQPASYAKAAAPAPHRTSSRPETSFRGDQQQPRRQGFAPRSSAFEASASSKSSHLSSSSQTAGGAARRRTSFLQSLDNDMEHDEGSFGRFGGSLSSSAAAKTAKRGGSGVAAAAPPSGQVRIIIAGLPKSLALIYGRTVQYRLPPRVRVNFPFVLEEPDNAQLLFQCKNKHEAELARNRFHNSPCYGARWDVEVLPWSRVTTKSQPCIVDVVLSVPKPLVLVETVLRAVPGLLAVQERYPSAAAAVGSVDAAAAAPTIGQPADRFVATFADEGSALHARAVLSGRPQDGAHFFLHRRGAGGGGMHLVPRGGGGGGGASSSGGAGRGSSSISLDADDDDGAAGEGLGDDDDEGDDSSHASFDGEEDEDFDDVDDDDVDDD